MGEQMREIEAFEQSRKDARNPKLRPKLRVKTTGVRLTQQEYDAWKRINVPLPELIATGIRHHRKNEDRSKQLTDAVHAFLSTADNKTLPAGRLRSILFKTPLRPTLEEIADLFAELEADRKIEALYRLL